MVLDPDQQNKGFNSTEKLVKVGIFSCNLPVKEEVIAEFLNENCSGQDKTSWFASDLLCLWEVQEQMTVPSVTTRTPVDLQAGTALCVTHLNILGEADSSAEMMEWKKEGRGARDRGGCLMRLRYLYI